MLQQILKDMYIDPDVLDALNEDQKKTLFLKMRQEQVRRWQEREDKLEREGGDVSKRTNPKKENCKSVSWLLGRDGDVAVIVIGEVDELSSRFICSGLEKKSPSLQNNTLNQSILTSKRTVEPNKTDTTPPVTPSLNLNKDTSTLLPLSVSVSEHSTPPAAAEKSESKPVGKPEEKSVPSASFCPRPFVRANAIIHCHTRTCIQSTAYTRKPHSQETSICKDVAPSRVTVRSASEDPLSSGTKPCAGRGRVAELMRAFSTESSAGTPQSPGQTPTRGTKPPLPTKPSHLRATATPSVR
ncbi:hypothetical protein WMY93_008421 [Mugilogobius chulae]|uniref:SH2 domain containing 4A n=1 Tax=Mugilogobius chulae TaxID=88201 RepID=A0AAW0PFX3_9GOBI